MLDDELPLWTIRPNWGDGIRERLSWLTDVLKSSYGTEQTRALRVSPRREFEIQFNPIDEVRSYFELFLHRLGSVEFMLPLFHDQGKLSAAVAGGATVIPVDTTYREFTIGGLALLLGDDPWTYDKLTVVDIDDGSITVEGGNVTRAWTKGATIYPLRRSRFEQESALAALTNRVGASRILFQLNQANDLPDEGDWDLLYNTYPVLQDRPNWREERRFTMQRNSLLVDNETGLRYLGDDSGRAFTFDTHNRMIRGRAAHWAFRQFLYRLRGQQNPIWVPTFNADLRLVRPAASPDARLDVKKIGYAYTGGAVSGRRHVLLAGSIIREINGTAAALSATEERLTLSAAVGTDLPAGTIGSFMEPCRLASDDVEILHYTDTDGTSECELSFRAFRDERTAPAILSTPIPEANMGVENCGEPALEESSCYFYESGWWARIIVEFNHYAEGAPFLGHPLMFWAFSRDGTGLPGLGTPDNYWTWDDIVGGYCNGAVGTFWTPDLAPGDEEGFPTDPFIDGDPTDASVLWHTGGSFPCNSVPWDNGCGGYARAWFKRPNQPRRALILTTGGFPVTGTPLIPLANGQNSDYSFYLAEPGEFETGEWA